MYIFIITKVSVYSLDTSTQKIFVTLYCFIQNFVDV